jgi:hypothetical protein
VWRTNASLERHDSDRSVGAGWTVVLSRHHLYRLVQCGLVPTASSPVGPGADVARASLVPAQMWQGQAQSQCRCGRVSPVPVQMWERVGPVPVQMWQQMSPIPVGSPAASSAPGLGPPALTSAPGLVGRSVREFGYTV